MKAIQEYMESRDFTALAATTKRAYSTTMALLDRFCQSHRIRDPDQIDLEKFVEWLQDEKPRTDQTIQQYLTQAKIFLKTVGHPSSYTFKIGNQDKQARKVKHSKRWFSQEDIDICLAYPFQNGDAQLKRIVVRLLIETGCRVQELADVSQADISLKCGKMYLSKTKTDPRPVFFSPISRGMLETLLPYMDKDRPFPPARAIQGFVNAMLADLGLKDGPDGRGPHTFRHFFATQAFFRGRLRIEEVAALMGDTVEIVRDVYLHAPEDFLRERVAEAMNWR